MVDQTHLALFKAKFDDHYPISTLDELADFYAMHGAKRDRGTAVYAYEIVTEVGEQ